VLLKVKPCVGLFSIFSICQQFLALSAIFSCFSLDRTAKNKATAENG
jgi:hypothetical protein